MADSSEYLTRPENQRHLMVSAILRRWDPIGVISAENQDEYDGYAAHIVRMLDAGANTEDLVRHMCQIVTVSMGMSGFDEAHSRAFAQELVDFWRPSARLR